MPAAEADDDPVSSLQAAELLRSFKYYRHVAIAVSGGGDSMALMWLAVRWAGETPQPPRLTVLTVDHGLRANSAEEAGWVAGQAQALGLAAVVLAWHGNKPATGVQARARAARYQLLIGWCVEHGAGALVTAHSLEDQAETFVMRLARGSGVDGLAGMRAARQERIAILRPLLGVARARLRNTLLAAGLRWLEDPSNLDPRFERVRWRKALGLLEREGLSPAMIALSSSRLERARQALEHATSRLEAQAVAQEGDYATVPLALLRDEPEELVLRLLGRLILRYGTGGEVPELAALERLGAWLWAGHGGGRTLAGCRIARRENTLRIGREPERRNR